MIAYKHKKVEDIETEIPPSMYKHDFYKDVIAGNLVLLPNDIAKACGEAAIMPTTKLYNTIFRISLKVIYDRLKEYSNFKGDFNGFVFKLRFFFDIDPNLSNKELESVTMPFFIEEFEEIEIENKESIMIDI